jgi:hypothetical protein
MARIDFGRIYTVEHNVKVYEFGEVSEYFMDRFMRQWLKIFSKRLDMSPISMVKRGYEGSDDDMGNGSHDDDADYDDHDSNDNNEGVKDEDEDEDEDDQSPFDSR